MSGTQNPVVLGTTVSKVGVGSLAVTGLTLGWTIHLAFFMVTMGLTLLALAAALGVRRRSIVIDHHGSRVPVPSTRPR